MDDAPRSKLRGIEHQDLLAVLAVATVKRQMELDVSLYTKNQRMVFVTSRLYSADTETALKGGNKMKKVKRFSGYFVIALCIVSFTFAGTARAKNLIVATGLN
jgi:hypothetical protein